MGILIGDPSWRGKGVAKEVIFKTSQYLKKYNQIKKIYLGVDNRNKIALKAYKKAGFKINKNFKNSKKFIYKFIMVKNLAKNV
jgi:RimJ/RimL family protein N-acetyltransferase